MKLATFKVLNIAHLDWWWAGCNPTKGETLLNPDEYAQR